MKSLKFHYYGIIKPIFFKEAKKNSNKSIEKSS
jgi:hypothetical protein